MREGFNREQAGASIRLIRLQVAKMRRRKAQIAEVISRPGKVKMRKCPKT
jgi:hypothetical protein